MRNVRRISAAVLGVTLSLLVAGAGTAGGQIPIDGTWQLVTDAPAFSPRDCGGALVFQGRMWLLGGWHPQNDPTTNSEIWSSADGTNWQLETIAPWEGRHCAGYAVHRGRMWIVGGDNNLYHYQNDVWSSADGINWTQVASDVPWRDRVTQHVLAFDDRLWVLGGQQITDFDLDGGRAVYNDVWSSEDGATWTQVLEHAPWSPRGQILGAVVYDGKMWVVGGGTYNEPRKYYHDVWSSPDGVQWERVASHTPWYPREYHNVTVFDGRMWVLGGYNENNLDDVWSSADGIHWRAVPSTPWASRHAGQVFVFNDALWMIGGTGGLPMRDVWKLPAVPPLVCDATPRSGCALATSPAGASLDLRDRTPDSGDAVTWRWRGAPGADFGLPPGDTGFTLCLYTGAASPHLLGGALAAGICDAKSCWDYTSRGYRYRDPQLFAGGTKLLDLANNTGNSSVLLRGKSGLIDIPPLASLALPLTVQLQGTHGGCWEAQFSATGVRQHSATRFAGKSD